MASDVSASTLLRDDERFGSEISALVLRTFTAYTFTSANAEFQEKEKDTIEPGKLADIAVLSQNIFTVPTRELPKTVSVLTMVGGKVVYEATDSK